jgi:chemotaxis response regulator CheB
MAINVLIVDDSGVMRAMIQKTMKLSGLQPRGY